MTNTLKILKVDIRAFRELPLPLQDLHALDAFLHPLSSALLIYLIIYSWVMRGRVQWKGRTI